MIKYSIPEMNVIVAATADVITFSVDEKDPQLPGDGR
jgi:hypothetical protein